MRTIVIALCLLCLTACGGNDRDNAPVDASSTASETANENAATGQFDLAAVPMTTQGIGVFPFFNPPEGFRASGAETRMYEQKYVYPGGEPRSVEGQYYHARVFAAEGAAWNSTLLLRSFDDKIRELGGVQVFDGAIPDAARTLIEQNEPKSIEDLYDPWPYRFRQYVIRTAQGPVWIELGYGYNAEMGDVTIIQEGALNQTISLITADQIGRDIEANGKAVLHINFDTDRASLQPDGVAAVTEIAAVLERTPDLKLSIEGHTDDTGSVERNRALSLERAETVRAALVARGTAPARLKTAGFGSDQALVTGTSQEDRARNRRVELVRF